MSFVITSALPFPNIYWWCIVLQAEEVRLDASEHFQKMSFRNRYYVAGGNGILKMSIPLSGGRDQKSFMYQIKTDTSTDWQKVHWRTLISTYNKAPFFSHYEPSLSKLFRTSAFSLFEFNRSTIHWLGEQLNLSFTEVIVSDYRKNYPGVIADLRKLKPSDNISSAEHFPKYFQLFQDRHGFIPNLSVLDLLFSEGPYSGAWLREHAQSIAGTP